MGQQLVSAQAVRGDNPTIARPQQCAELILSSPRPDAKTDRHGADCYPSPALAGLGRPARLIHSEVWLQLDRLLNSCIDRCQRPAHALTAPYDAGAAERQLADIGKEL